MKKLLLLFLFTSLSSFSKPGQLVGKVSLIRGKVTLLAPGKKLPNELKLEDRVLEDASIVTREKSFVQIRFDDGSLLNIGPSSKVVVAKMDKEGNGIINLLKGKLRSDVKSNYEKKKRFFIRTRNTAVGVRGTEFETIYNPENQVTSLLTYQGEVAIAKTEDSIDLGKTNLKKAKRAVRRFDNKIVLEEEPELVDVNEEQLDKILSKESVVVKKGQFSQTVTKLESVSQPVVISPVQLNALYQNPTFKTKDEFKIKPTDVDPTKAKLSIVPETQSVPPEGIYNAEKKIFAPKAGGFIDRETGLYVPPSEDALFDQNHKVYYASNVGQIDSETGQYEPPVGLALDPKVGFVTRPLKEGTPSEFVAKVAEQKEKLNQSLAMDVIQSKSKETTRVSSSVRPLSNRELISKNIFSISYSSFSQTYNHESDTYLRSSREFESESGINLTLSVDYASGSRFQPFTSYTIKNIEFPSSQRGSYGQVGTKLSEMVVGARYSLKPKWNMTVKALLDQQYFLHHRISGSNTVTEFTRITIPKLQFGLDGTLIRSGRFSTELATYLGTNLPKTSGDQKLSPGLNYGLGLALKYWIYQRGILSLGLNNDFEVISTEGTTRVYEADTKRSTSALTLSFATYF